MGLLDAVESFFTSEASGSKAIADWGAGEISKVFGKDAGAMAAPAIASFLTPAPPPKPVPTGVSGEDPSGISGTLAGYQAKLTQWWNTLDSLEKSMVTKMGRDDLANLVDLWQGDTGIYSKAFDACDKAITESTGLSASSDVTALSRFNTDANSAGSLYQHAVSQAQQIYQKIQDAWAQFSAGPSVKDVAKAAVSTVTDIVTVPAKAAAHAADTVYNTGKADLEKAGSAIAGVGSEISGAFTKFIPYLPYIGGGLLLLFILPYLPKPSHANPHRRRRR
jgi:hypothetical protein